MPFAWRDDERVNRLRRDQRSQGDYSEKKKNTTLPYRCVAANCRNVVDLSKCIFVHNIPSFNLANKQPFRENTTDQVGTDSSNSFSGICLDGNC